MKHEPPTGRRSAAWGMLALMVLLGVMGCGYSTRPMYSAAYRTVSVPIFQNKSFRRGWEDRLTEAIKKNIEARTPMKVVTNNADTVLSGEILDDAETVLTKRLGTNLPREVQVTVRVNFMWKERAGHVLVERKDFNRTATEVPQLAESADDAEQLAIERLAAAIVEQMQEPW